MKITIHEIARALDIDSSTVSRALNGSSRVSDKTRKKILAKADEMGYSPNRLASNLRRNKSNTIGVVIPRISRYFFSTIIAGVEEAAFSQGYNVVISQSLEESSRESKILDNFITHRMDGVLMSIAWEEKSVDHLKKLIKSNTPLVFFDRHADEFQELNKVIINDYQGAFEATEHLIFQGCKKIVHLAGPQTLELYRKRLAGYKMALKKHDLIFYESMVNESRLVIEDGAIAIRELIQKHPDLDGLFSANDRAAVDAMKVLQKMGKRIPEDIAIAGFSNDPLSLVTDPPLTTVDQFGFEMGKKACRLLIDRINNQEDSMANETVVIAPKLIIRASSKRF